MPAAAMVTRTAPAFGRSRSISSAVPHQLARRGYTPRPEIGGRFSRSPVRRRYHDLRSAADGLERSRTVDTQRRRNLTAQCERRLERAHPRDRAGPGPPAAVIEELTRKHLNPLPPGGVESSACRLGRDASRKSAPSVTAELRDPGSPHRCEHMPRCHEVASLDDRRTRMPRR